jgi:hypothetical protein
MLGNYMPKYVGYSYALPPRNVAYANSGTVTVGNKRLQLS